MEQEKFQVLAQLNQEVVNEVARLQNALDIGNVVEVEKIKESIMAIQKKIANSLEH